MIMNDKPALLYSGATYISMKDIVISGSTIGRDGYPPSYEWRILDQARAFVNYQDRIQHNVKCYTHDSIEPCKHARGIETTYRYCNLAHNFTLPRALVFEDDEGDDCAVCIDCLLENDNV